MKYAVAKLQDGSIRVKTVDEYQADPQAWDWIIIESVEAATKEEAAFKFGLSQIRNDCALVIEKLLDKLDWGAGEHDKDIICAIKALLEVLNIQSFEDEEEKDSIRIFRDKADGKHFVVTKDEEDDWEYRLDLSFSPYTRATLEEIELDYWDK